MESKGEIGLNILMNGKNFPIRQFHFKYFLEGHGMRGLIDGSSEALDLINFENHQKWKQLNGKIVSLILNSV